MKRYYFSVEGETERLYLKWLEESINTTNKSDIEFKCDICSPSRYVKRHFNDKNSDTHVEVVHLCDYEGRNDTKYFYKLLGEMKTARLKNIDYKLGYCNFTFELWLILHKMDFYTQIYDRTQYLVNINKAYGEKFRHAHEYKTQGSFIRGILHKLTLNDVNSAIERTKFIMNVNKANGYIEKEYKGYRFYVENPSLSIHEHIEKILVENGLNVAK
jgi:hypothetical protein